jgi:RNA 3'-terminal phosphate cyclase (ATP)
VGGGRVVAHLDLPPSGILPLSPAATRPARFEGSIVWSRLPDHVPTRIDHALRKALVGHNIMRITKSRVDAACPGVAATLWADMGGAVVGASIVGRRGLPSEAIGDALAREVLSDVEAGASVDAHLLDQLVPYAAMARGVSVLRARDMSLHARTALDVCGQFRRLDVGFDEGDGLVTVRVGSG